MRVLVTGAGGQLGRDLSRALDGHEALLLDHALLDVTDEVAVRAIISSSRPDAVVHTASWTDVDACELDPERAKAVNADGARAVADAAEDSGAFVVTISTDYVFGGDAERPYVESDSTNPIQVYGATKLEGETTGDGRAVVRTAWLYGAGRGDGRPARNFVRWALNSRGPLKVVTDQVGSPTPTVHLARALVELCVARTPGLFHVACQGSASRFDLAAAALAATGGDPSRLEPCVTGDLPARPAARPAYAPLDGPAWRAAGFAPLPTWQDALGEALREDGWVTGD